MPPPKKKGKKKGKANSRKSGGGKKGKGGNNRNNNNRRQNTRATDDDEKTAAPIPILGVNVATLEEYSAHGQTFPATINPSEFFPDDSYPVYQTMPHPKDTPDENGIHRRMESSEEKAKENMLAWQSKIRDIREAAEIHKEVRASAQRYIQPGMTMTKICDFIETGTKTLVKFDPDQPTVRSWGFPTGCSLDHCAAHYTPNPGDTLRLRRGNILKIDFGVQINGYIIDSAFTMAFEPKHNGLMAAVKAATNRGVEVMGIDARLGEIGAEIEEVMESHECVYDGKSYPVKCIRNLSGHSIGPWIIHGGKTVPIVATEDQTMMEEGEVFAIETFGSTGRGLVENEGACSHFAKMEDAANVSLERGSRDLLRYIDRRFGTLPFCRRWIYEDGHVRHLMDLKRLVDQGIVRDYPPLCDIPGCYTAQYEHTILLRPTCKEIVSRGPDF